MPLNPVNQPPYLYIKSGISALHINVRYLPLWPDHHCDGAVNYVHTGLQKGRRRRDITTAYDGLSRYGIIDQLYQFFTCLMIIHDQHSLKWASLTILRRN